MFDQIVPVLQSGAVLIAVTMTLGWVWAMLATMQRSRSQLLTDMEPLFLWVEIQTINSKLITVSRNRAILIVFASLGVLLWALLAVITALLHSLSPELLTFLLSL